MLRSKSDEPYFAEHRELLHKIGVTGGEVAQRIANTRLDATFLLADVEVVATYRLFNINRSKLENIIHKVFGPARLDVSIEDRFGNPVVPREWFLVPLFVIDEAVERIKDGTHHGLHLQAGERIAGSSKLKFCPHFSRSAWPRYTKNLHTNLRGGGAFGGTFRSSLDFIYKKQVVKDLI